MKRYFQFYLRPHHMLPSSGRRLQGVAKTPRYKLFLTVNSLANFSSQFASLRILFIPPIVPLANYVMRLNLYWMQLFTVRLWSMTRFFDIGFRWLLNLSTHFPIPATEPAPNFSNRKKDNALRLFHHGKGNFPNGRCWESSEHPTCSEAEAESSYIRVSAIRLMESDKNLVVYLLTDNNRHPNSTVTFLIGPGDDPKKFVVHREIVCYHSPVLESALSKAKSQRTKFKILQRRRSDSWSSGCTFKS